MGAKRTKDYKELGAPGETEEGLRRPNGIGELRGLDETRDEELRDRMELRN